MLGMKRILSSAVLMAIISVSAAPVGSASAAVPRSGPSVGTPTQASATAQARAVPQAKGTSRPTLILRADGLAVRAQSGQIRRLPFGSLSSRVTVAVRSSLGTGRTSPSPECGQGPRSTYWVKGFSLLFKGKKFVGWTDQGAPRTVRGRLAAADGTGVGITLARLRLLHPRKITVTRGSLGAEFTHAGKGINGLLTGTRPTSRVTTVYAGETCFFR